LRARARVLVSGKVQGVFFRAETADKARKLNVTGWVRNLPDGRVEAVFEGEEEDVHQMIEFCRNGPPLARVSSVRVIWEKWKGEFRGFEVRH
jgi:acylphosphatase